MFERPDRFFVGEVGIFREEFLSKHSGYKTLMIEELQSDLDRLNMLKRDNWNDLLKLELN